MHNTIGIHYLWDVRNIDPHRIEWVDTIRPAMERILKLTPLDIVSESYKQFDPVGVTGVYLLSESHFSIHTWPEHGYIGLDLFSCVAVDYNLISQEIKVLLSLIHISEPTRPY